MKSIPIVIFLAIASIFCVFVKSPPTKIGKPVVSEGSIKGPAIANEIKICCVKLPSRFQALKGNLTPTEISDCSAEERDDITYILMRRHDPSTFMEEIIKTNLQL